MHHWGPTIQTYEPMGAMLTLLQSIRRSYKATDVGHWYGAYTECVKQQAQCSVTSLLKKLTFCHFLLVEVTKNEDGILHIIL